MSRPHLQDLERALNRRGWRIVTVLPGNGYDISATWELCRGGEERSVYLEFEGQDHDGYCRPLERSFGCQVRGRPQEGLYFRRVNASRALWEKELEAFVKSLGEVG